MRRTFFALAIVAATAASAFAQTPREQLARGQALWDQRLAKSAIAALEMAARDKATAAEAHEALGRLYTFKGWQQDNVLPGWHDEPGSPRESHRGAEGIDRRRSARARRRRRRCERPKDSRRPTPSIPRRRGRRSARSIAAAGVSTKTDAPDRRDPRRARGSRESPGGSGAVLRRRPDPDRPRRIRSRDHDRRARRGGVG